MIDYKEFHFDLKKLTGNMDLMGCLIMDEIKDLVRMWDDHLNIILYRYVLSRAVSYTKIFLRSNQCNFDHYTGERNLYRQVDSDLLHELLDCNSE